MTRVVSADRQAGRAAPEAEPDLRRLRAEAIRVHRAIFGADPPDDVQRQYAQVLQEAQLAEFPRCDLTRLVAGDVDLEALELALRRKAPINSLTQRFHVICYLVEVRPEYFDRFVNEPARFATGVFILGLHTVRSLYKLIKGRCLMWIHRVG